MKKLAEKLKKKNQISHLILVLWFQCESKESILQSSFLPATKKYFGDFKLIAIEEKLYEPIQDQDEDITDQGKNSENKVENFKGFIDLVVYVP